MIRRSMARSTAVRLLLLIFGIFGFIPVAESDAPPSPPMRLTSPEDSFTNAIEGFGTDLQCFVNTCPPPGKTVKWFKDNKMITDGLRVVANNSRWLVRHNVALDHTKDCTGRCSSVDQCGGGFHCLDNSCCQCAQEEFTLVMYNLTLSDSGIFQCRLDGEPTYMEFELQVLEGGTFPSFSQNLTFDYSECCEKNAMSNECRPMCRPSVLEAHKFDPIPCQKEFGKLLSCATNQGNTSHVHCCRLHFVPPFCWDYCSGTNTQFERANRLCVYWMPEIFQCYEQAYLPLPGHPEQLVVNPINATSLYACWQPPKQRPETVNFYSIRYQEVPRFPFFGGSVPFLTGEEGQSGFEEMGVPPVPIEPEENPEPGGGLIRRPILSPADGHEDRDGQSRGPVGRKKRQTLVITTHNFATNETEVREYRYQELNTTDTCATIEELKPATQYTVYVTATNDFGTSLPSIKATASTGDLPFTNATLPNIRECCVQRHVDAECVTKMCDVSQPPSAVGAFDIALTCRNEFPQVAPCLADGRDHTECCRSKGVGGECLKMCDGSASYLGVSSVLCLSLDMNSIYSCLRQGYVTHPSPPTNLTVNRITGTSAVVKWSKPEDNAEKVVSYSLFYRTRTDDEYTEIKNATSPYELDDLEPDTSYSIYAIAYTPEGRSLKSSVVQFSTGEHSIDNLCQFGQPLRDAYGFPVLCGPRVSCPVLFNCVESGDDDDDARYCCPTKTVVDPDSSIPRPNITACCAARGVKEKCLDLCSYDTTTDDLVRFGRDCLANVKTWIECGGDGRDDRPCCVREKVPEPCTDFCFPSTVETMRIGAEHIPCVRYVREISKCGLEGVYNLPGPPRNLRVFGRGSNWVALLWDTPVQAVTVDSYEVYLADGSRSLTFNTSSVSLTIPDLKRDVRYTAHVRSLNNKGSSVPTENVTFTLGQEEPSEPSPTPQSSGDLPSAPVNVTIVWYKDRKANLTWAWMKETLNKKPIQNYEFNISYGESIRERNRIQWTSVQTKDTFLVLDNLKPSANYDAYVTAKNLDTKQQGFPSSVLSFKAVTARSSPSAEIQTFPSGALNVGDKVSISCVGKGDPAPNVTLYSKNGPMASGVASTSAVIEHVSLDDSNNLFECISDNGDFIPFRTSTYLKIRYLPQVTPIASPVTVIEELPARVSCRVRGFPIPDVSWYYQNESQGRAAVPVQITLDEKHSMETKGGERDNFYNATLTVYQAGKEASGAYFCKACNDLGCANTSVKLIVDPWPVPQGPDYLLSCCKQEGILPECMSVCTDTIDVNVYEQNTRCIDEFPKLMACTNDGVDQTSCCRGKGVPSECLSYCNRRLLTDGGRLNLASCQKYTNEIIQCAEDAHRIVPGTPANVRAQVIDSRSVNITWDPPVKKGENIPMYVVYYKRQADNHYSTVRTENTWVRLPNLETGSEYNITVIAANNYGFSLFTPLVSARIGSIGEVASASGGGSHSTAGTVLAVIFCLLLAAVLVLAAVYFKRRPHRLPTFLLKLTQRRQRHAQTVGNGTATSGAVAFENPGYDREAQVRGLPGDKTGSSAGGGGGASEVLNGSTTSNGNGTAAAGWDQPHLETPQDSPAPQRPGKYTQLT